MVAIGEILPLRYCLVNWNWPLVNGGEQEPVPEYVPVALVELKEPEPLRLIVQLGKPETPPAGTLMLKVKFVPVTAPEMFPLNTVAPEVVLAVIVPPSALPV